ncbi:hypothetical protein, partial [Bradyrhizobium sp. NBAIM08]|uniref:hypothetical protein n=1 Tax=Bradyrhizobium sp. NBAIM08 TaxID=2793815 RepID=UPI001CD19712
TLFGVTATGDFHLYRFREDNGTWPAGGTKIGSGWQSFSNVTATTDTCKLNVDHSPARPSVPRTSAAPVDAIQAGSDFQNPGPLHFSYTRDGILYTGSTFPGDPSRIQWTVDIPQDFTGKPTVLVDANQAVRHAVQRTNSDLD